MKRLFTALYVFLAASSFGLDIITRDGKAYWNCEVKKTERDGVRIMHRDGTAFLDFDELPSAIQKQFGWTAEKSAARKVERAAEADKQRIAGENARRAMEERAVAIKAQAEANAAKQRLATETTTTVQTDQAKNAQARTIQPAPSSDEEKTISPLTSIFAIAAIMLAVAFLIKCIQSAARNKRIRALEISHIDFMSGVQFEQYLQILLTARGLRVSMTPASGDLGVDLIASSGRDKFAIQVKRYSEKVSRLAISDAVAGSHHYGCNKAMVITNNYFTRGAIILARSTNCLLVDRDTLGEWVVEFQKSGG